MKTFEIRPGISGQLLVLPNQLTVVMVKNPKAPSVSVIHWVKGGSMQEHRTSPDGRGITGIAHLFEHMMFRPLGAGKPAFDDIVQKLGAKVNANTRNSATVYISSVGSENLHELLKAEADRFQHLHVTDDLLALEKKAVESEYQVNHDSNPNYDLWETITRASFPNHPLEWGVSGFRADLYTIKAEDCNAFFSRVYRPNNIGLFIVGDFDFDETKQWVTELYSAWPAGDQTQMPPPYQHKDAMVEAKGHVPSESSMFWMGFRIPYPSTADHARDLAHFITFYSSYSLANRQLVDELKLASAVSSVNYDYDTAMIKLAVVRMPHASITTITDHVLQLADTLKNLSDEDFTAYQARYNMGLAEGTLRNAQLADMMAHSWGKYGDIDYALDLLQGRVKLSKEQVVDALAPLIVRHNTIIATSPSPSQKH